MMIGDAILRAATEHQVFFLVTAYIETARYCSTLNKLPQHFLQLPLAGVDDVKTRFDVLTLELVRLKPDEGEYTRARITEALGVLDAAISRLGWLGRGGPETSCRRDPASLIDVC